MGADLVATLHESKAWLEMAEVLAADLHALLALVKFKKHFILGTVIGLSVVKRFFLVIKGLIAIRASAERETSLALEACCICPDCKGLVVDIVWVLAEGARHNRELFAVLIGALHCEALLKCSIEVQRIAALFACYLLEDALA